MLMKGAVDYSVASHLLSSLYFASFTFLGGLDLQQALIYKGSSFYAILTHLIKQKQILK